MGIHQYALNSICIVAFAMATCEARAATPMRSATTRNLAASLTTCGVLSVVISALLWAIHCSAEVLNVLALSAGVAIALRVIRVIRYSYLGGATIWKLTLLDCLVIPTFLWVLSRVSVVHSPASMMISLTFGYPILFMLATVYIVHNCAVLVPERLRLAEWRLLAYAFPTAHEHNVGRIGTQTLDGLRAIDILGWVLTFVVLLAAMIFGYWLAARPLAVVFILAAQLVMVAGATLCSVWQRRPSGTIRGRITAALAGAGLIATFVSLLVACTVAQIQEFDGELVVDRVVLMFGVSAPLITLGVEFLPTAPHVLAKALSGKLERSPMIKSVRRVARAATHSAFTRTSVQTLQAISVALVFLVYHALPRSERLLTAAGLTEINGYSVESLACGLDKLAVSWTIPSEPSTEQLLSFIFGNHGLVLLFLVWSAISFLAWTDVSHRIVNMPGFCSSAATRFVAVLASIVLTAMTFPLVLCAGYAIAVLSSVLVGDAIAVIFGALSCALFLPRLEGYFFATGLLAASIVNTDRKRDCINVNQARTDELCGLPHVGKALAKRIISARPLAGLDDLANVQGIGKRTIKNVHDLIRFC